MTAHLKLVSDPLDTAIQQRDDARSIAARLWDENERLIDSMRFARDILNAEPCGCRDTSAGPDDHDVDPCLPHILLSVLTLPTVMPL